MRLLYVTRVRLPSRAAQSLQVLAMARAFYDQLGVDFCLVSGVGDQSIAKPPFHWVVRKRDGGQWPRYAALFAETFIRARAEDGVIIYTRDIALALAAVLAGRKALYEAHKQPTSSASWIFTLLARSGKFKLVAISGALAEYFTARYRLPKSRVLVAHDGAFPEDYRMLRGLDKASIREELKLPKNKLLVVHTGSLYKGGAELYEYIARASTSVLFLHIGGSDAESVHWAKVYRQLNLNNVVFLPHMQPERVRLYQMTADLLFYVTTRASPMYWCTSPLKIFEYMATGVPILGARVGSVCEILDESNAFCFDPDDPTSIADAFDRFRLDAALAKRKADKALKDVEEKYSWDERAARIIAFSQE